MPRVSFPTLIGVRTASFLASNIEHQVFVGQQIDLVSLISLRILIGVRVYL